MLTSFTREWPRYCPKVYWTKMVQNGPNDPFGQNDLKYSELDFSIRETKMVHFGLKRSILVHLGPPTVLWPFLIYITAFVARLRGLLTRTALARLFWSQSCQLNDNNFNLSRPNISATWRWHRGPKQQLPLPNGCTGPDFLCRSL